MKKYRLKLCTNNLNSTKQNNGHPSLKHCYASLYDAQGNLERHLSFGLNGVVNEENPNTNSTNCREVEKYLSEREAQALVTKFEKEGRRRYQWGKNDCCTMLEKTINESLGVSAPKNVSTAARNIRCSRDMTKR